MNGDSPLQRRGRWVVTAVFAGLVVAAGFSGLAQHVSVRDRYLHVGAWLLLGFLLRAAVAQSRRDGDSLRVTLGAVALACTLGALDELAQTWAPLRSAEWADLLADAVGGTLGALLHLGVERAFRARSRS
jgi:VanZ family protein